MRKLGFLLLLLSFSVLGQTTLTPDVATDFVHNKINDLNLKIWNAVHKGELIAFRNDSLTTQIYSNEIYNETRMEKTIMIPNPENPGDPYDLVDKYVVNKFDSSSHFAGVNLHYSKVVKAKKIAFKLISISSLWKPESERGYDLSLVPLYHIKVNDLKKIKELDFSFYIALFSVRASLGDFINPYFSPFDYAKVLGQEITLSNTWHSMHYIHFSDFQYDIVGHHLAYLPIAIGVFRLQQSLKFFKDEKLSFSYIDIKKDLQDSAIVMIPNPDNLDDPYDLVAIQVYEQFDLERVNRVSVTRIKKDFAINLIKLYSISKNFEVYIDTLQTNIYYSLRKSKKLLKEEDYTLLESILEEITR